MYVYVCVTIPYHAIPYTVLTTPVPVSTTHALAQADKKRRSQADKMLLLQKAKEDAARFTQQQGERRRSKEAEATEKQQQRQFLLEQVQRENLSAQRALRQKQCVLLVISVPSIYFGPCVSFLVFLIQGYC